MSKFHYLRDSEIAKNVERDYGQLRRHGLGDITAVLRLYYALEFAVGQALADGNDHYYPNASFSVVTFLKVLRLIRGKCASGARFLDVGCGLGGKVSIAQSLGFDAYGLEINRKYAEIAAECLGTTRVFHQDGVAFPDYGRFDVIYFYNPMPSDELETAILTNAKRGALIYHAIGLNAQPRRAFARLTRNVMHLTDDPPGRRSATSRRPAESSTVAGE